MTIGLLLFIGAFFQYIFCYINVILPKKSHVITLVGFLCFALYWFVFGGITNSTDWLGYEHIFENDDFTIDFTFRFLSTQAKLFGLSYINLYQLHVFFTGGLIIYFISRFTSKIFLVTTFLILILFIPLANQIRFFLSLSLFINAAYFLCIKKNILLFLITSTLSVITHIAILPLFLFCNLYFIKSDAKFFKYLILISFLSLIFVGSLFSTFQSIYEFGFRENFFVYIQSDYLSSFLGTLFQILPISLLILFVFTNRKKIIYRINYFNDQKFKFIYRLTLFSFVFIAPSFFTQIILFRYCVSLCFVWIILILLLMDYTNKYRKGINVFILFLGLWLFILYKYVVPITILNSYEQFDEVSLILNSINFDKLFL